MRNPKAYWTPAPFLTHHPIFAICRQETDVAISGLDSVLNALAGHRILVLGGYGFLGKHLIYHLDDAHKITLRVPTHSELDLSNQEKLIEFINMYNPTVIFHLAAHVSGIESTSKKPVHHLYRNSLMALNLMAACYYNPPQAIIAAGSVCMYPEPTPMPMHISAIYNGPPESTNFSYGMSKRLLHASLESLWRELEIPYGMPVSANLYGPGDNFDTATSHVIPALIQKIAKAKAANEKSIEVWGDGSNTRDFLYVEDAARAYLHMAAAVLAWKKPLFLNIGSGEEVSIRNLTLTLMSLMDYTGNIEYKKDRPSGQRRRLLDIEPMRQILGWTPTTSLRTGLANTIAYYETIHEYESVQE